MSAYGTLHRPPSAILPSTAWKLSTSSERETQYLTLQHLNLDTAPSTLVDHAHAIFAVELDSGDTYPQELLQGETLTRDSFTSYFFQYDVVVGVIGAGNIPADHARIEESTGESVFEIPIDVEQARSGRPWEDAIAGFYYVKPNYPGRSSHICNGGFVVAPRYRGLGYGRILARSYLYYAPRLGYEASVFNLVYVNNVASIKLWEKLGFTKAGRIPRAGRLKCEDGTEKYFDAWVFYKSFVGEAVAE